ECVWSAARCRVLPTISYFFQSFDQTNPASPFPRKPCCATRPVPTAAGPQQTRGSSQLPEPSSNKATSSKFQSARGNAGGCTGRQKKTTGRKSNCYSLGNVSGICPPA